MIEAAPARFAYADPPYPGLARRYYGREPTYAGEVDHAALIARLEAGGYLGWALSTSAAALRHVLPMCPPHARVCPWTKPNAPNPRSRHAHVRWEQLIVVGGRAVQRPMRDWLHAAPAKLGGETLIGRKPLAFCAWLFDLLGMAPGDELDDLFPGTGIVGRAWAEVSRAPGRCASQPSREAFGDASQEYLGDASPRGRGDASRAAQDDASARAQSDASGAP